MVIKFIYFSVHLRVRQMDQKNPKSLFPSSSAITYWQVEMQEGPIAGTWDSIRTNQLFNTMSSFTGLFH